MTNVNTEREKVKKRIVALLNKTVESGATQSEAFSASEKANELMKFYDIEFGELEFKEKNIVKDTFAFKKYGKGSMIDFAAVGIARMCQVRLWKEKKFKESQYVFCGFKHDVEIAKMMLSYIQDIVEKSLQTFKNSDTYRNSNAHGLGLTTNFIRGMNAALQTRMFELAKERSQVDTSTGTSLVTLKEAEIDSYLNEIGVSLNSGRKVSNQCRNFTAFKAGQKAGNNVSLNKTFSGNSANLMIS